MAAIPVPLKCVRTAPLQPTKPPGISPQELERIARISDELREGFESLADIGPAVSIFGSARSKADSWEYQSARDLARKLAAQRIAVITGGGPGVMEAGNLGARVKAGGFIGPDDLDYLQIVEDADQAAEILLRQYRDC